MLTTTSIDADTPSGRTKKYLWRPLRETRSRKIRVTVPQTVTSVYRACRAPSNVANAASLQVAGDAALAEPERVAHPPSAINSASAIRNTLRLAPAPRRGPAADGFHRFAWKDRA